MDSELVKSQTNILMDLAKLNMLPDWAITISLLALGLITRLPFMDRILYHWDSVNFAFAMKEFNLAKDQPQPPGYILYVWFCRLIDLVFHDPQTTMVSISVVASTISIILIYALGKEIFGKTEGLTAALFLTCSPLFWFYGEIALPHTSDTLFVILSATFLYKVMRGDRRYLIPVSLVLAIAGGLRQQTLVFLIPLILFAFRKLSWRSILLATVIGGILCLGWFLPLVISSGGVSEYLRIMNAFTVRFQSTTSVLMGAGLWGLQRNAMKYSLYTLYGWSLFIIPAIIGLYKGIKTKPVLTEKEIFFILWILPATVYYLFIHMGQQGLVFFYLPALILVSSSMLVNILKNKRIIMFFSVFGLAVLSASIFLLLPEYPLGSSNQRLLTRDALVNADRYFIERIDIVRKNFQESNTIVVASSWHYLQYYIPNYKIQNFSIGSKWEIDEGVPIDSQDEKVEIERQIQNPEIRNIVVFDPEIEQYLRLPYPQRNIQLQDGEKLKIFLKPNS